MSHSPLEKAALNPSLNIVEVEAERSLLSLERAPQGRCPCCRQNIDLNSQQDICRSCGTHWKDKGIYFFSSAAPNNAKSFSWSHFVQVRILQKLLWNLSWKEQGQFLHGILAHGSHIVDVGSNGGHLVSWVFGQERRLDSLRVLRPCSGQLKKMREKLPDHQNLGLICTDFTKLPFHDHSVKLITLFEGLNFIEEGPKLIQELARVLSLGGILRGSIYFLPQKGWKHRLALQSMKSGLIPFLGNRESFHSWVDQAGLSVSNEISFGDALLFELTKSVA